MLPGLTNCCGGRACGEEPTVTGHWSFFIDILCFTRLITAPSPAFTWRELSSAALFILSKPIWSMTC